jgi:dTDP-4-dehydrorhamnose 3,5-epimerase
MEIIESTFKDLYVFKPRIFEDHRGYFFESFSKKKFQALTGLDVNFVQDNQSLSAKNVLRGLHFQIPPFAQGKLVRVVSGAVLDVVLDLRKASATYGQSYAIELNAKNQLQMYIPEGFAHGFLSLQDNTVFEYKCTNYYEPTSERTLLWNDETIHFDWKVHDPIIAEKDISHAIKWLDFNSPC